jgi:hypothetical protein
MARLAITENSELPILMIGAKNTKLCHAASADQCNSSTLATPAVVMVQ